MSTESTTFNDGTAPVSWACCTGWRTPRPAARTTCGRAGVSTRTRTAHASGWSATSSGSLPEPGLQPRRGGGQPPRPSPGDVRQGFGGPLASTLS
jgi:hypothetical protein